MSATKAHHVPVQYANAATKGTLTLELLNALFASSKR